MAASAPDDLRRRVAAESWWHTLDLAPGVTTPGWWDLRPTAARVPWPGPLSGLRCLDVGTMDGFWAFEMERRGASDVMAIDLADPARQDAPRGHPSRTAPRRGATFAVAAEALGSRAECRDLSVYDLRPEDVGRFDVVLLGYVLQMLRDPIRALEAVAGVCRGHAIVVETVSLPLSLLPSPVARLNGRRGQLEWFVFNRAGLAQAMSLAGLRVEAISRPFRDTPGPAVAREPLDALTRLKHAVGLLGRSVALTARAPAS